MFDVNCEETNYGWIGWMDGTTTLRQSLINY